MKKIILTIVLFIFINLLHNYCIASGSFDAIDFKESYSVVVGQKFSTHISFFYSGTQYKPKVSLIGTSFPPGMVLNPVSIDGTSLYSVLYSGIPTSIGDYSMIVSFSDDFGALLNKKITFKVVGLVFDNNYLPNATALKPYSYDLYYTYPYIGNDLPRITFFDTPQDINISSTMNPNSNSGKYFTLKLIAYKSGEYRLRANVKLNGFLIGDGFFILNVDDPNKVPVMVPTAVIPIKIQEEVIKKPLIPLKKEIPKEIKKIENIIKNNESDTKIEPKVETIPEPIPEPVKKLKWYQKVFNWFR